MCRRTPACSPNIYCWQSRKSREMKVALIPLWSGFIKGFDEEGGWTGKEDTSSSRIINKFISNWPHSVFHHFNLFFLFPIDDFCWGTKRHSITFSKGCFFHPKLWNLWLLGKAWRWFWLSRYGEKSRTMASVSCSEHFCRACANYNHRYAWGKQVT